jgi:hypothetical protein
MLPDRQKLCITELPEGYRVVGVEDCAFVVRDPRGRHCLLEQDGHLYGVTTRRNFVARRGQRSRRLPSGTASSPYTIPMD